MPKEPKVLPIGSETIHCVEHLVKSFAAIDEIAVVAISRPTPLQKRIALDQDEEKQFQDALDARAETGLPFWDCLLMQALKSHVMPRRLLSEAAFHQSNKGKMVWLKREAIIGGVLRDLAASYEADQMLSILSEVRLRDGTLRHFVFLDFHIPAVDGSLSIVRAVAELLIPYGSFIIESGASYHVIGCEPVDELEFKRTLTTALLFGPITDRAYLAHQLLEGRAALRISKGGHFNLVPRLAAIAAPKTSCLGS